MVYERLSHIFQTEELNKRIIWANSQKFFEFREGGGDQNSSVFWDNFFQNLKFFEESFFLKLFLLKKNRE